LKELILRTLTGVTLIVLVTGSILLGPEGFSIILLLLYLLGVKELFGLLQKRGLSVQWFRALPGLLLIMITYAVFRFELNLIWLVIPPVLWILTALRGGITLSGTLSILWLAIPLASFLTLGWMDIDPGFHSRLPLYFISLVWVNDTFAYITGSLIGKHKMAPILSPGKTWEGFFGGLLITLISGWIVWRLSGIFDLWGWFGVALLVSLLGLGGDLFESGLKRSVKVKNTGQLLPGHGGILDRFDSLLFSVPVVLALVILLKILL
jgi:phosphatidate cytidylyltransferase